MSNTNDFIKTALERRFSVAGLPTFPGITANASSAKSHDARVRTRRPIAAGYAAAMLVVAVGIGSIARASNGLSQAYARLLDSVFASSTPLHPGIHAADRLTIAQAQHRMPFEIVEPIDLPANTHLMYAHILKEKPVPQVLLQYEAHIGDRYYSLSFEESMTAIGPPQTRFELGDGKHLRQFFVPMRRWKDGPIVMQMFAYGLPENLADDIERANTR